MSAPASVAGSRRLRADLALVGNTLAWGCTFVVVKRTLEGVSPLLFLAMRFTIAAIALMLLFPSAWRGREPAGKPVPLRAGLIAGCFLFSGYAFQTIGLRLTSAAKSAFITGLSIALVPLAGALVYKIRPRLFEVVGVCCATAGLGLLTLRGAVIEISRGDLLTLCCALCFAAHIVTVGHYAAVVAFQSLAVIQVGTAALLSLASFWWFEPPFIQWSPGLVIATLFGGLVATAGAFTAQAWAQQYTTSTRTALIYALEPVFAWITSFVVMGEGLSGRMAFGAVLILAGILLVELKPALPEGHP
jgi:drug/metabolite transporter (DMT)-like permease